MASSLTVKGKRIGLLTASASRLGGGVFEAVVEQAEIITECGAEPVVFALEDEHSATDRARFGGVEVRTFQLRGPRQVAYAPGLTEGLRNAGLDCLHLHGIWQYPSRAGADWADSTRRAYIISPHGMLDPWITSRSRWKKALARAGYERAGWRRASFLHALTEREASDIARESGRHDNIVISNAAPQVLAGAEQPREANFTYIGRIHPKKNLLSLIAAWSQLPRPEGCRLTIAGWGDQGDISALEAAVRSAGPSVQFVGPVYGAAKQALLAQARFMVLPSLSEGLPMAVLEGWSAGTPSILTADCNLPEGFAAGAALECGHAPGEIAKTIQLALAMDQPEWLGMASAAKQLAAGPFSRATVAERWIEAYGMALAARPASLA